MATSANTVLVDVRAEEEFRISRNPGAVHIDDPDKIFAFAAEHSDKSIVLYCSVGVRPSKAVQLLQNHGFKIGQFRRPMHEGANQGRSLVNSQGSTNTVHSYNLWWGWRYLSIEARAN